MPRQDGDVSIDYWAVSGIILVAMSGLLGFIGFVGWGLVGVDAFQYAPQEACKISSNPTVAWSDACYEVLRLFVLDGPLCLREAPFTQHWPLHVARFLAPLALAYNIVRAGVVVFSENFGHLGLWWRSGHTLICGAHLEDEHGRNLARKLSDSIVGSKSNDFGAILCFLPERSSTEAQHLRNAGVVVAKGDPTERDALIRARVDKAKRIVVAMGDERDNVLVLRALSEALTGRVEAGQPKNENDLHCHVRSESGLVEREWGAGLISHTGLVLHPFSLCRAAARRMVEMYPPWEKRLPQAGDFPLHVVVSGAGAYSRALIRQLMRVCHFADRQRVRITVLGLAEELVALESWVDVTLPAASMTAELAFEPITGGEKDRASLAQMTNLRGPVDQIFIALEVEDGTDLAQSLRLPRLLTIDGHSPPRCVISRWHSTGGHRGTGETSVFSVVDEVLSVDVIINEQHDRVARKIHEYYDAAYSPKSPTAWEALTVRKRDSNRDQVDHLWVKLAVGSWGGEVLPEAVAASHRQTQKPGEEGADPLPIDLVREVATSRILRTKLQPPTAESPNPHYDADLVELLAEVEHRRWMGAHIADGGMHNWKRDDEVKHHPSCVPWEDMFNWEDESLREGLLTNEEVAARHDADSPDEFLAWMRVRRDLELDKDRDTARRLPEILAAALEGMAQG